MGVERRFEARVEFERTGPVRLSKRVFMTLSKGMSKVAEEKCPGEAANENECGFRPLLNATTAHSLVFTHPETRIISEGSSS